MVIGLKIWSLSKVGLSQRPFDHWPTSLPTENLLAACEEPCFHSCLVPVAGKLVEFNQAMPADMRVEDEALKSLDKVFTGQPTSANVTTLQKILQWPNGTYNLESVFFQLKEELFRQVFREFVYTVRPVK
jgi:hypothetical protein